MSSVEIYQPSETLNRLRQAWGILLLLSIAITFGGYYLLRDVWQAVFATRWFVITSIMLAVELMIVWRGLIKNHRPNEDELLPSLGAGNAMTLIRGALIAMTAGFLFSPWPEGWLAGMPGLLYTFAVFADYFDGYLARITDHATELGGYLDMQFDALGMLVVPLLGVWYGQLPVWYLLVSVIYYLYVAHMWLRRRQGKPVYPLPESMIRRLMAGTQMVFVFIVLLPVYPAEATHVAAIAIALPLLIGFTRDWMVTAGALDTTSEMYKRLMSFTERWLLGWVPAVMRIAVSVLLIGLVAQLTQDWEVSVEMLQAAGMSAPNLWLPLLIAGYSVCAILMSLGLLGRIVGIVTALLIGVLVRFVPLDAVTSALILMSSLLLVTGTGFGKLGRKEHVFFLEHGGGHSE